MGDAPELFAELTVGEKTYRYIPVEKVAGAEGLPYTCLLYTSRCV